MTGERISDDPLGRVPYLDGATANDVAIEVGLLIAAITGALYAAVDRHEGPEAIARMLDDDSREPGKTIRACKTRLALALEGFAGRQ